MQLADALRRGNNNFDLLRLIAAVMVIVGHSYALVPVKGEIDPVLSLVGFAHSGSLAVKFFFFLSGILVTNSLLQKRDIVEFTTMRALRVVPAIAVCSAILALIVGPIFTTDQNYFSNPQVFRFIWGNSIINIQYTLPGVFENLPFNAVNASLWTIPYEVCAYLALAGLFLVGALNNKHVAAAICVFFIVDSLIPQGGFFLYFYSNDEVRFLPFSFALGALCAIYKDRIDVSLKLSVGLILLNYIFWFTVAQQALFYAAVFFTAIFVSTLKPVVKLTPKWDISYGIYVYGWPAQQIVASVLPGIPRSVDMPLTIAIAVACGCLSWVFIERPALKFGRNLMLPRIPGRTQAETRSRTS
ncbi:acyltransferase family protein [Ochrobactrum sp. EEELCW01]|nr:acyltransferase family protein [Ochrobactrum sp. EEELCW01]